MKLHANARTCPNSRRLIVDRVAAGWSLTEAAEAAGVSDRTAAKWMARWRAEGDAGLLDRSSAPGRVPHRTSQLRVAAIEALRRLRMTGAEIAELLKMPLSTVGAVLQRIGLGKLSRLDPLEPPNRYERSRPGELLHVDIKKLGRILTPGHRVTGDRRSRKKVGPKRLGAAGWEFVHVCVDDATRLAYAEVLPDERGETAAGFLRRAVAWFNSMGIQPERVLSDNWRLLPLPRPRRCLPRARPQGQVHAPLPAQDERQSRALHQDAHLPLGLRRDLRHLSRTHPSPARLAHPLQLHPTTRRPQPPTTRSSTQRAEQPDWELQLALGRGRALPAAGPVLQLVDPLGRFGLVDGGVELLAGLVAQGLEVGRLGAGHRLAAGGPFVGVLLEVVGGLGLLGLLVLSHAAVVPGMAGWRTRVRPGTSHRRWRVKKVPFGSEV